MKTKKMGLAVLAVGALAWTGVPRAMADDAPGTQTPPAPPAKTEKTKAHKPKFDADKMLKKLTDALKLTQDEQDKIKPIVTDEASQLNAVEADQSLTKPQKKDKEVDIRKASEDQIAALLTPEQLTKFNAHRTKDKAAPKAEAPKAEAPKGDNAGK